MNKSTKQSRIRSKKNLPKTHKKTFIIVANSLLFAVWIALIYGLIFRPLYYTEERRVSSLSDAAAKAATELNSGVLPIDSSPNTEGDPEINLDNELLRQRYGNFPFYDSLPVDSQNYFIDIPTDDGILPILADGQNGKQEAIDWIRDNNGNPDKISIDWTIK